MNYQQKVIKRLVEGYEELPDEAKREVLDQIKYGGLLRAAEEVSKTRTVFFGDLFKEVVESQKYFNSFEGFGCGLEYFDDAIMGFRPGELLILAAPSNFGKTLLSLNVVANLAITGKRVLVISMEMTALEIARRLYNTVDLKGTNLVQLKRNIIIQTELRVNSRHIEAMIKEIEPDIVLIDHLQFLAKQEQGTEYERISKAVGSLKSLAMEYKLPMIVISHVAKSRSGKNGQATASDLKGASDIEQDCDVGIMINKTTYDSNEVELTLFKHRTKRPPVYHKPCILEIKGVRVDDNGSYYCGGLPSKGKMSVPMLEETQEVFNY